MKIVIPGGTGQVGNILSRAFCAEGHEVVLLSRSGAEPRGSAGGSAGASAGESARASSGGARVVGWDAKTLGDWADEIDGADVVINLAGRSVNCRYTQANMDLMMTSRVESTRVVGEAIQRAESPPAVWLQMSTATIYAHRFDAANDEHHGIIGGDEHGVPAYWGFSVAIAKAWEDEQQRANTSHTRKVALRTAMVMSPDEGGVFDVLRQLTRIGLGGTLAGGEQYVSWIHEHDFVRAVKFLIENEDMHGPVNLCAPTPLPQREFMASLRAAMQKKIGLPATKWMLEVGAFFMRSDTELLLKSRRVIPRRLCEAGFSFEQPSWANAAQELVTRAA